MAMVARFGQMVQNMKDNGKKIKLMEEVNFGIQMEITLKGIGKMIKLTVLEFIYTQMERNMKVIGKMIYKMDLEQKFGIYYNL